MLENKETGKLSTASTIRVEGEGLDPWTLYLYSMKSPAKRKVFDEIKSHFIT